MKIVCIGDSITAGERNVNDATDLGNGYVKNLSIKLKLLLDGSEVNVINKGINGTTISDLLDRVQTDVVAEAPDVVVLEGGINDVRNAVAAEEDFDVASFRNRYTALVATIKATGAKLIIIEPFVLTCIAGQLKYRRYLNRAMEVIEEVGYNDAVAVVHLDEMFNGVCAGDPSEAKQWAEDGIHPTHRASRHIANILISKIQNKLIAYP